MHVTTKFVTPLISSVAVVCTLLAGCSEAVDRATAGRSQDSMIASADRGADDKQPAIGQSANDAAITASVKAQLARDAALSALQVSIETSNGLVLLRGNAPSVELRERATEVASSVPGVANVDNQMVVSQ